MAVQRLSRGSIHVSSRASLVIPVFWTLSPCSVMSSCYPPEIRNGMDCSRRSLCSFMRLCDSCDSVLLVRVEVILVRNGRTIVIGMLVDSTFPCFPRHV